MRTAKKVSIQNVPLFKNQLLQWAQQYEEVVWLDSNDSKNSYSRYDAVMAVEAFTAIKTDYHDAFDKLQEYQQLTADWLFGYLSYDLKNDTEDLISENFDGLHFPELYFFQPKKVFLLKDSELEIQYLRLADDEIEEDLGEILCLEKRRGRKEQKGKREDEDREKEVEDRKEAFREKDFSPVNKKEPATRNAQPETRIKSRISRETYLEKVNSIQRHIQRGDIYEANFCQEFYAENAEIDPLETFKSLNTISNPPFATFLKLNTHYLLSASPERYLKKDRKDIISQPIKGTARRASDAEEDKLLIAALDSDPKERSENVMIVDLVRNDLSKTAKKGSVKVEELCRIYTFRQVHQMISTVKAELEEGIPAVEVLRSSFPMGSMTGAPKISAMKIMEELEETKRGLYSGAVGYFTPDQDFDFSVVIRSILYNEDTHYVSFSVGGAITAKSIPEKEYEECLLKAKAMREVLQHQLEKSL